MTNGRTYLKHLDGLRAIAVLAVIVYHLNTHWLPGGFVGVDVFFVISGFLITRNIVDELSAGRFSIKEFYRRRIKRIAPLALLVIATTTAVGYLIMLPDDAAAVAKSAVWSLVSMANFYFWNEVKGGYFAPASEEFPLLHLWSLGIEEQFYLVWPLILAAAGASLDKGTRGWRYGLAGLAALCLLASLGASIALSSNNPTFSFYMLPTRAFELLVGALVAILGLDDAIAARARRYAGLGLMVGAVGVVLSVCLIDNTLSFPGMVALAPALSTALLIASGSAAPTALVARALSLPLVRHIGVLSYAAYLWHWPLMAFFRYLFGAPGIGACFGLLVATFVLAEASHRLLETPARLSTAPFWRLTFRQFLLPAGLTAAACVFLVYGERAGMSVYPAHYLAQVKEQSKATVPAYWQNWVCQRQRLTRVDLENRECVLGSASAASTDVVVFGDSNAAHYVPMLEVFARSAGYRFRNVEIGACPPVLDPVAAGVDPKRRADCVASLALAWPTLQNYSVVMLGGSWTNYQLRSPEMLAQLRTTIQMLLEKNIRVVLLAKIPTVSHYDRRCTLKKLRVPMLECAHPAQPVATEVVSMNAQLRALAASLPGVSVFDPSPAMCANGQCTVRSSAGTLRYYDAAHLSVSGSYEIGREILLSEGVPKPLDVCDRVFCSPNTEQARLQGK